MRRGGVLLGVVGIVLFLSFVFSLKLNPRFETDFAEDAREVSDGLFLGLGKAGDRVVAVGEHGRIVFSDDGGRTWIRARVPVDQMLTSVFFLNGRVGWITGHEGVILKTEDSGKRWSILRYPSSSAGPLFDIHFEDAKRGIAVGADSSVYLTDDGGVQWKASAVGEQTHLYAIAGSVDKIIWVMGENAALYDSEDAGKTWNKCPTPFHCSLFGSVELSPDRLLIFGLNGRMAYCRTGECVEAQPQKDWDESLFAGVRLLDGRILLAGERGRFLLGQADLKVFHPCVAPFVGNCSAVLEVRDALIVAGDFGLRRISLKELR